MDVLIVFLLTHVILSRLDTATVTPTPDEIEARKAERKAEREARRAENKAFRADISAWFCKATFMQKIALVARTLLFTCSLAAGAYLAAALGNHVANHSAKMINQGLGIGTVVTIDTSTFVTPVVLVSVFMIALATLCFAVFILASKMRGEKNDQAT